jgi:hypothetical protein
MLTAGSQQVAPQRGATVSGDNQANVICEKPGKEWKKNVEAFLVGEPPEHGKDRAARIGSEAGFHKQFPAALGLAFERFG